MERLIHSNFIRSSIVYIKYITVQLLLQIKIVQFNPGIESS